MEEHAGPRRNSDDPYRVLGVSAGATQRDIARAYRQAAQRTHPDAQPRDPQAVARFQALTAAYDLLRDPSQRAEYDRDRLTEDPSGQPPRPGPPASARRWRGSPFLLCSPPGQPVWAGPVHIEPPATAFSQYGRGASAAEFEDPVVILGVRPGWGWGWPW